LLAAIPVGLSGEKSLIRGRIIASFDEIMV